MGRETGIEWTDATWNPIRGCSRVSEGCRHCYAETTASRFAGPGLPYEGLIRLDAMGKSTGQWSGAVRFVEQRLLDPLRWKESRRIFVNSMSDLFHENVTDEMRDRIFAVMALCPQHTFQVLTKRPDWMLVYMAAGEGALFQRWGYWASHALHVLTGVNDVERDSARAPRWPLPNVWFGVSVENQATANERIPLLLQTPAALRFVSAEPLLEPLKLSRLTALEDAEWSYTCLRTGNMYHGEAGEISDGPYRKNALDWVIVGGESGPGARPMHPEWARTLRDQCKAAGVPFFFKQWGEWAVSKDSGSGSLMVGVEGDLLSFPFNGRDVKDRTYQRMNRVGKKAAGHLLDGVAHREMPEVRR